jgi:hypothetical protein
MKKQKAKKDKHQLIKEKIVEALEGRKQKEEDIIALFFGKGEMRKEGKKKHKEMYEMIVKNLSIMNKDTLNDIHRRVANTGEHLI